MSRTIYICIKTHGFIVPSKETNPNIVESTVSYLTPPRELIVTKFNIACPGTTGFNFSPECSKAKQLLDANPNIDQNTVLKTISEELQNSFPNRVKIDKTLYNQRANPFRDTSTNSSKYSGIIETDQLLNKIYQIDEDISKEIFSIDILNGQFKEQNILNYNFLQKNIKGFSKFFVEDDWFTLSNGTKVLYELSLTDLLLLLVNLKITNVCLIDPSCSINMGNITSARASRGMKRSYINSLQNSNIQVDSSNSSSTNPCYNCVVGTVNAGINCCKKTANYLTTAPVSMRMEQRYNQGDSVYIMVNGKRCHGNIRQINGNNAIVDIDPDCSNGISSQTVRLDQLEKMGGRKIKTRRNKKGKMKNNKRNKTTKKYRRKRTLKNKYTN